MSKTNAVGDFRVKTASGETYIAATQRPDGTWRKARRVKTNYIPQDEQPKFQCKAQQALKYQSSSPTLKYPIGWSPIEKSGPSNGNSASAGSKPAGVAISQLKQRQLPLRPVAHIEKRSVPITPQDHLARKIHGLRKKLDEIETLKAKIDNGELAKPERTQLQKMERKSQIEDEIASLTKQISEL